MPKTLFFTPDHWVVPADPIRIGGRIASRVLCAGGANTCALEGQRIDFRAYTWGNYHRANGAYPTLTVDQFLPYFYGYVSAGT
ncbi:MAG: hypothetical protein ACK4KV_09125 [Rhodocyclaceae bacterium]